MLEVVLLVEVGVGELVVVVIIVKPSVIVGVCGAEVVVRSFGSDVGLSVVVVEVVIAGIWISHGGTVA